MVPMVYSWFFICVVGVVGVTSFHVDPSESKLLRQGNAKVDPQWIILPPINPPPDNSDGGGGDVDIIIFPPPVIDPPTNFWVFNRYFENDACNNTDKINYMNGVRGGECLLDLEFLHSFEERDNETLSYKFVSDSVDFDQTCSAVRLERYRDHHCLQSLQNSQPIIIPSEQSTNGTTEELWFGKCQKLWQRKESVGYQLLSCETSLYPPQLDGVTYTYNRFATLFCPVLLIFVI